MSRFSPFLAACLLSCGFMASAHAQVTGSDETASEEEANAQAVETANGQADERVVCRIERPIGSKLSRRVCRTVASIEEEREITVSAFRNTPANAFDERR